MKATEGNGGPGIVLHKGTVEGPEIHRGIIHIIPGPQDQIHGDGSITFIVEEPDHTVTYHRVHAGTTGCDARIAVDVRADTVVTWERRT